MAKTRLDELWGEYLATIDPLIEARARADEAYRLSAEAYKRWVAAGGEHRSEQDYGKWTDLKPA